MIRRIARCALAHINIETLRQVLRRAAKWPLVRDKEQSPAGFDPIPHRITFVVGKSGVAGAFVINIFSTKSVSDDENLEGLERLPAEDLTAQDYLVSVQLDQIGKGLIATHSGVKVVVSFIKQHAREAFCVGGIFD